MAGRSQGLARKQLGDRFADLARVDTERAHAVHPFALVDTCEPEQDVLGGDIRLQPVADASGGCAEPSSRSIAEIVVPQLSRLCLRVDDHGAGL